MRDIDPKFYCYADITITWKFQKDISSRTVYIPTSALFQLGSKLTNRLTDTQEIWNNFEIVQKYPGNVSKNFRKISHPEMEISLVSNFG